MFCQRCSRGLKPATKSLNLRQGVQQSLVQQSVRRTFASLRGPLRPSLSPSPAALRPSLISITSPETFTPSRIPSLLSNLPARRAFSSSPALGAPRDTFDPSHFVRKRRHGFLSRIRTRKGRALLKRRKAKRRSTLSH
ncbi:60S ribosomal protein-like protein L34 [Cadophora sp. MPI-SDFR-AT-0126]|nr:60S ribosomal protein-like protein L34 [Leotiomycetes sp. MPI-SDFR-AT-0126]